ncbi:MAG: hypothetical protein U5K79_00015 [Cyclobacteriaceae bacterium]|nr:hypothetical protein [Cyclobacteriaceae bacterium]
MKIYRKLIESIRGLLSPYAWVTNNPLLYADPFGLDSINYNDLPDTPFDPDNDVVILDEVEVEDTYTGPKAEDSSILFNKQLNIF